MFFKVCACVYIFSLVLNYVLALLLFLSRYLKYFDLFLVGGILENYFYKFFFKINTKKKDVLKRPHAKKCIPLNGRKRIPNLNLNDKN